VGQEKNLVPTEKITPLGFVRSDSKCRGSAHPHKPLSRIPGMPKPERRPEPRSLQDLLLQSQKLKEEARQLLETSRRLDDEVLKRVESVEKKGGTSKSG